MGTKTLAVSEVCAIIEACAKFHVRVFKFSDLEFELGPAPEILAEAPPAPNHSRQNAEALGQDEDEVREEQLRMMMIEDPVKYEQMLRNEELSDEPEDEESEE